MEPTDRINEQLGRLAETIDVEDTSTSLAGVRGTFNTRRRRRRAFTGVAVSAVLVGGGVVAINSTRDGGGSSSLSISGPETTQPVADTVVDSGAGSSEAVTPDGEPSDALEPVVVASPDATSAATGVEVVGAEASLAVTAPGSIENGFVEWLVPWEDGFLTGRRFQQPQALPESLPEEIVALFPQEVVDFFDGELPPTINEAITMLSEADLLDEVTAVLAEHPEANEAIYGVPTEDPEFEAFFSTDGTDWEPVSFTLPDGIQYAQSVQAVGDRLVMMSQLQPEIDLENLGQIGSFRPQGSIVVASTTDLTNWDIVTIPDTPRPADVPDFVRVDVYPQSLAANAGGWVVRAGSSTNIDVLEVLPADVRERVVSGGNGYYTDFDEAGITVVLEGPYVEVLGDDGEVINFEPEWRDEIPFTWAELGVPDFDVETLYGSDSGGTLWSARWGGTPTLSTGTQAYAVVGSSDGFYATSGSLDYSPDGLNWTSFDLPDGAIGVSSILPVDRGVIAVVSRGTDGTGIYRVTGSEGVWEPIEVPGLPSSLNGWFGGSSTPTSALIFDAAPPPQPRPTTVVFEEDGFTLSISNDGSIFTVNLVDASGAVLVDESQDLNQVADEPGFINWTEQGIEVRDPETEELIASFSSEVVDAAYSEQIPVYADSDEYFPDMWLLATVNGDRWLLDDLDDNEEFFGLQAMAINGEQLLIGLGPDWISYDLG